MTKEEWDQHVKQLLYYESEFNRYDAGYTSKQKERFTSQRLNAISNIKRELAWPPFAEIAREVTHSSWDFDECYDSMDNGMEQTIREILNKEISD